MKRDMRKEPLEPEWSLPAIKGSLCCNQAKLIVSVDNDEFDLLVTLSVHLKFLEISVDFTTEDCPVTPAQMQHGCDAILHCVLKCRASCHPGVFTTTAMPVSRRNLFSMLL